MYRIDKEYIETHTAKEIISETGMTHATLYNICKRYKVKPLTVGNYEQQLEELAGTDTDVAVSKIIGCCVMTVKNYRLKHNIPKSHKYRGKYTKEYLEEILEKYGSFANASKHIGMTRQNLSLIAKRLGFDVDFGYNFTKAELIELHEKYGNWSKASEAIGCSPSTLISWWKVFSKEPLKMKSKWTIDQLEDIRKNYSSWREASLALGYSDNTLNVVYNKLKRERK